MPGERIRRRTRRVGFGVLVLLAGLVPPSIVAAADLTFTPAADAHVNSGNPAGNYGGLTTMKVREGSGSAADPAYRGYLRFAVTGLTGGAASVKLRLFVTDASANSQGIYPIGNTSWTETGLTYGNAPPISGSALVSRTVPTANAYVEFVLPPSAVPGNGPVAFAIKSAGTDSAIFATREVAATPPQLVVTPSTGPPPPVAEFSGSPTSGPVGQSVSFDSSASQGSGLDVRLVVRRRHHAAGGKPGQPGPSVHHGRDLHGHPDGLECERVQRQDTCRLHHDREPAGRELHGDARQRDGATPRGLRWHGLDGREPDVCLGLRRSRLGAGEYVGPPAADPHVRGRELPGQAHGLEWQRHEHVATDHDQRSLPPRAAARSSSDRLPTPRSTRARPTRTTAVSRRRGRARAAAGRIAATSSSTWPGPADPCRPSSSGSS